MYSFIRMEGQSPVFYALVLARTPPVSQTSQVRPLYHWPQAKSSQGLCMCHVGAQVPRTRCLDTITPQLLWTPDTQQKCWHHPASSPRVWKPWRSHCLSFYEVHEPWGQQISTPDPQLQVLPSTGPSTHLQSRFRGLPCPRHGGPHHACGSTEGQLAERPRVHWAQSWPGCWGRVWMMQLGPWGASKVRGVQPRGPRVMGWVQVTCWCHLRRRE